MKDKIKEHLKEVEEHVYYGAGKFRDRKIWDCIVFGRRKRGKTENGANNTRWFVAIVKEEYIPEGMEDSVIEAMKKAGLKQTNQDIQYDYVERAGECMVEICTMEFCKTKKGC